MSKSRLIKNYDEAVMLIKKFRGNDHMLAMAMVQLTEREKVRVLNKYLENKGEPLLSTEAPLLPGNQRFEWVIDVPKEWISETGRDYR